MSKQRGGISWLGFVFGGAALLAPAIAHAQSKGGDLVIAVAADEEPASLDGQIDPYQSTWLFDSLIADSLIVLGPDGQYKPDLATEWSASEDGRSWTFKLRKDVKFQDGTPFNAEAVKFNLERIRSPEIASAQLASDIGPIKSVDVVDEYTVRINYDTPWVTLLDALRRAALWSPTAAKQYSPQDFDKHLVGTGPFKFTEWVHNDHITFTRWVDYGGWNAVQEHKGPVNLDSVTVRFIGEPAVLGNVLETGEAQFVYGLPALYVDQYKDNPDYQFLLKGQAGTGLSMVMNIRNPPLSDLRVRQALQYGKDAASANDRLYDGTYEVSYGPLNSVHPCYWKGAEDLYPYDPAKAKSLLEEAGWKDDGSGVRKASGVAGVKDGTPLQLRWTVIHHQEIGEVLQAQYKEIGIDLKIQVVPGPVQLDQVQRRDFDLMYERQRSPDPLILDQIWNSKWDQPGGWAWTGYKDAALDATLEKLRTVPDIGKRCEAAREAQKMIMEQALMLPTLSDPVIFVLNKGVKDFKVGADGTWYFLNDTTIQQ